MHCVPINLFPEFSLLGLGLKFTIKPTDFSVIILKVCCIFPHLNLTQCCPFILPVQFVEHCSKYSQDHPEVVTYLQSRYSKALPTFLSSVEFRNSLGRCLTRAQANTGKTFVYINELCTVLKQHTARKRTSIQSVPSQTKPEQKSNGTSVKEEVQVKEEEEKQEGDEETKKTKRASRRQVLEQSIITKRCTESIC